MLIKVEVIKIKGKKGLEGPFWVLIVAIALLLFLVIFTNVFKGLLGKEVKIVETQIGKTGDSDSDGVADFVDDCRCVPGPISNNGCPNVPEKEEENRLKDDC